MKPSGNSPCAICGRLLIVSGEAFALTQTLGEDRLRIYHWNQPAERAGLRGACCAAHVRELVIHWMVTSNLNYPFANSTPNPESGRDSHTSLKPDSPSPTTAPVGELAVDHDSVILDELDDALQKSLEENSEMLAIADLPDGVIHHF